jgi:hypothetical protein
MQLRYTPSLASNYQGTMSMIHNDKQSSLLRYGINYICKMFYSKDPLTTQVRSLLSQQILDYSVTDLQSQTL